jgi:hypothetical protein
MWGECARKLRGGNAAADRRSGTGTSSLDWPPSHVPHQLISRVRRVHAGDVRLRGKSGEVVDLIAYTDIAGRDRRVYRLRRHGVFIGEYRTPEELGKAVDLATLVEDDPGRAATPPAES